MFEIWDLLSGNLINELDDETSVTQWLDVMEDMYPGTIKDFGVGPGDNTFSMKGDEWLKWFNRPAPS